MDILMVVEAASAGVGRHVVDLALGLVRGGHKLGLVYSPLRMDAAFGRGLDELARLGAAAASVPMRRAPHPSDLSAALAIRRILRARGPFDVIHGHSSKGGALARLAAAGLPGARVYTPHAMFTMDESLPAAARWTFRAAERALDRVGHGVILVSDEEKRHALGCGLAPEKLFVVPNGVDPAPAAPREPMRRRFGLSAEQVCVGFTGRFARQKAPADLLRAFALLAPQAPQARLAMVGEGPLGPSLREEARRLGLGGKVLWAGILDGREAAAAFDVFALPSRYEGLSYALLEGMAAGLPVAMTQVGGAGSVVRDGQEGLVVPVGSPEAMADALLRLVLDAGLRRRLGEAARVRVREFSVEKMASRTLDVYGVLLGRLRG
ncbi:MAG: glycosyltransferase [Elusimicrobia bacterium]|nr:glycosyltransferase [Elusimicrobiota bacterium]